MKKIRWAIMGTGGIAHAFAEGLKAVPEAELVAVGSRRPDVAAEFARKFSASRVHSGYAALAADPGVDVVYISTIHPLHRENTLLCLEQGKAVLCEKPFAMNLKEAQDMVGAARARKLFLMEAMWTHFFPAMEKTRELIAAGAIGEVRMVTADFGFRAPWNPAGRILNRDIGGGSLLDVGVYATAFTHMAFGREPERVSGFTHIGATGVDEQDAMILQYSGGGLAALVSAMRTQTRHEATIYGTEGRIQVPPAFWHPERIIWEPTGKDPQEFKFPLLGNGYSYEAAAVCRDLLAGRTENDVMPQDKTLGIMRTLDRIRADWPLKYAADAAV